MQQDRQRMCYTELYHAGIGKHIGVRFLDENVAWSRMRLAFSSTSVVLWAMLVSSEMSSSVADSALLFNPSDSPPADYRNNRNGGGPVGVMTYAHFT